MARLTWYFMLRCGPTIRYGVNYGVLRATKSASNIVKDTNLTMSSSWVRAILLRVQDLVRMTKKVNFWKILWIFRCTFSKIRIQLWWKSVHLKKMRLKKMHFNPNRYCCFGLKKIFHRCNHFCHNIFIDVKMWQRFMTHNIWVI